MDDIIRLAQREDIPFIESVINDPDVREYMGDGSHPLSFDPTFEYALTYVSKYGVLFGENIGEETFMGLAAFTKEGHGLHAMLAIREGITHFFTQHEVVRILGNIRMNPPNRRMLRGASVLGFDTPRFVGGRAIISADYLGWSLQNADCYQVGGMWMDDNNIIAQADDMAGAMGAFLMTAKSGLVAKAVKQYEIYAMLSHTKPIIFSPDADRLYIGDRDITDAVVSLTGV